MWSHQIRICEENANASFVGANRTRQRKVPRCHTAYKTSSFTAAATEAAGKGGSCTDISATRPLCIQAVKA